MGINSTLSRTFDFEAFNISKVIILTLLEKILNFTLSKMTLLKIYVQMPGANIKTNAFDEQRTRLIDTTQRACIDTEKKSEHFGISIAKIK